jgi:hypothetical protein
LNKDIIHSADTEFIELPQLHHPAGFWLRAGCRWRNTFLAMEFAFPPPGGKTA